MHDSLNLYVRIHIHIIAVICLTTNACQNAIHIYILALRSIIHASTNIGMVVV